MHVAYDESGPLLLINSPRSLWTNYYNIPCSEVTGHVESNNNMCLVSFQFIFKKGVLCNFMMYLVSQLGTKLYIVHTITHSLAHTRVYSKPDCTRRMPARLYGCLFVMSQRSGLWHCLVHGHLRWELWRVRVIIHLPALLVSVLWNVGGIWKDMRKEQCWSDNFWGKIEVLRQNLSHWCTNCMQSTHNAR